jgi:hypothetical protein
LVVNSKWSHSNPVSYLSNKTNSVCLPSVVHACTAYFCYSLSRQEVDTKSIGCFHRWMLYHRLAVIIDLISGLMCSKKKTMFPCQYKDIVLKLGKHYDVYKFKLRLSSVVFIVYNPLKFFHFNFQLYGWVISPKRYSKNLNILKN